MMLVLIARALCSRSLPFGCTEGISPRWRGDGKELFYVSGDQKTSCRLTSRTKPDFQFSATKLAVPAPLRVAANLPVSVTSDGRRFLVSAPVAQNNGPQPYTVVL
jgi:hypothetical protein